MKHTRTSNKYVLHLAEWTILVMDNLNTHTPVAYMGHFLQLKLACDGETGSKNASPICPVQFASAGEGLIGLFVATKPIKHIAQVFVEVGVVGVEFKCLT